LKFSLNQKFNQQPYASGRLRALITILLPGMAITHAMFAMIWNAALGAQGPPPPPDSFDTYRTV